jgi:tetratricopeptide (TPR) repeat protein
MRFVLLIVAGVLNAGIACPQSLLLQADTPEEFDAYIRVLEAKQPADIVAACTEFERAWPRSELLAHVYQLQMEAHRKLGDIDGAVRAGERAVALVPNHIAVLTALANILPTYTEDPQRVARAEELAAQSLKLLRSFRVSRNIPLEEWERLRARLRSEAHSALGLVAMKRNEIEKATREFETAISLAPEPDPVQHYRLGGLYLAQKREAEAREKFRQAAEMKDPVIRKLAEERLSSIRR